MCSFYFDLHLVILIVDRPGRYTNHIPQLTARQIKHDRIRSGKIRHSITRSVAGTSGWVGKGGRCAFLADKGRQKALPGYQCDTGISRPNSTRLDLSEVYPDLAPSPSTISRTVEYTDMAACASYSRHVEYICTEIVRVNLVKLLVHGNFLNTH